MRREGLREVERSKPVRERERERERERKREINDETLNQPLCES